MNARKIFQGALLGAAGGMAMAMWSMIALAATGDGFFAPVNLIAHAVWRDAPSCRSASRWRHGPGSSWH